MKVCDKGFTLAEVLITLAIIGVIAAITISPLFKNSQDSEFKTQFKKVYNTLTNATLKVNAALGTYPTCFYTPSIEYIPENFVECSTFFSELKKSLKIIKDCPDNAYSNGCVPNYASNDLNMTGCGYFAQTNILNSNPAFVLSDGTIIIQYYTPVPLVLVDINGKKPPNKAGFDVFDFLWAGNNDFLKISNGGCFTPPTGGKTTYQMMQDAFK